jgi:hypothetical protein
VSSTFRRLRVVWIVLPALGMCLLAAANPARAERPPAASLLPDNTVAYVSVADTNDFVKRFMQTAVGRMSQQERMKPLIERLYRELKEVAAPFEDQLGLSLGDLLAIPQGQITFAVVAPEGQAPALIGLLDVKEQIIAAEVLLGKADKALREGGAAKSQERAGSTTINVYKFPGSEQRQVSHFEREGTLVLGTSVGVLKSMLTAWDGERAKTLALNKKYSAITQRCRGTKSDRPQVTWYVDALGLIHALARDNTAVQFGMTLLENQLGLKGLQAIGGSITIGTERFDSISRMHILLDNPRKGVLEVLALGSGDVTPEKWVPQDVAGYMTIHWHVKTTYQEVGDIVDTFAGEGFTASRAQSLFKQFDVDFEKEVLPALDNRFTIVNWVQKPVTLASSMSLFGVRLKEPAKAAPLLEKAMKKLEKRFETQTYGGKTYYRFIETRPDPENGPPRPRPCVCLLDEYLLISDRQPILERAIKASQTSTESLAIAADFKLIADHARLQCNGAKPAMIAFQRPEEGMRFLYDLLTAEENRRRLRTAAASNRLLERVNKALDDNPLPPFEALRAFLAPAGSVMLDEVNGIHYVSFALKAPEK